MTINEVLVKLKAIPLNGYFFFQYEDHYYQASRKDLDVLALLGFEQFEQWFEDYAERPNSYDLAELRRRINA